MLCICVARRLVAFSICVRVDGITFSSSLLVSQGFLKGTCRFGEECRFSHDKESFVAEKPADLPGSCPFASLATGCPFGMTCRYYLTHDNPAKVRHATVHHRTSACGWQKSCAYAKRYAAL
jgi:hypothetical protein